jgi:hypothetical protein
MLFCVFAVACAACGGSSSTEEKVDQVDRALCQRVRDHLVDLRLRGTVGVNINAHRAALQQSLGEPFLATCEANYTLVEAKCLASAEDEVAASHCHAPDN